MDHGAPGPQKSGLGELTRRQLLLVALGVVAPIYLLLAWGLAVLLDERPAALGRLMFPVFGVCAALGLGLGVASIPLRRWLERKQARLRRTANSGPLIVALALSETAAFLGLVYFAFFRDWTGFGLLLAASLLAFLAHAKET